MIPTRDRPVAAIATVALAIAVFLQMRAILAVTGGQLLYYADDAYIEMATAVSLAEHGVWGVTPDAFTGVCTSLAWPLLLAAVHTLRSDWWPLVLNIIFATGLVWTAAAVLSRFVESAAWRLFGLLLLIVATPLAGTVAMGMEHNLQAFTAVLLTAAAARVLVSDTPPSARAIVACSALAAVTVLSRYDTAAVVAGVALCAAMRRRWRFAAAIVLAGALPALIYAAISTHHGWPWLPVSVLMKQRVASEAIPIWSAQGLLDLTFLGPIRMFRAAKYLWPLGGAAFVLMWLRRGPHDPRWRECRLMLATFLIATYLQFAFGAGGEPANYHYDAYLIAMGVVTVGGALGRSAIAWRLDARYIPLAATVAVIAATATLGTLRGVRAFRLSTVDARLEFLITHQMALLMASPGLPPTPAVQDLGEISYMTRGRIMDLDALATPEIFSAVHDGTWTEHRFLEIARSHGTRTAAILTHTIELVPIPRSWRQVAEWGVTGANSFTFFAADDDAAMRLKAAIDAFDARLPPGAWRIR